MKLARILSNTGYQLLRGESDTEIEGISYDSRQVKPGDIFICIKGEKTDGHNFIDDAVARGAVAVVAETSPDIAPENDISIVIVPDTRKAMAEISSVFYGNPAEKLTVIGITGTKGKTTTGFMLQAILNAAGIKTGIIGTIHIDDGYRITNSRMTTPESCDIHRHLHEMVKNGCRAAVMEVSSQALKLKRTAGIIFDYAVFTNLGYDHISQAEHKSIEEYVKCKSLLFSQSLHSVVNGDDKMSQIILDNCRGTATTYGYEQKNKCVIEYGGTYLDNGRPGVFFTISGRTIRIPVCGRFTPLNAVPAIVIARKMGAKWEPIIQTLKDINIPGRQECFTVTGHEVIMVDYAHNGMALQALMEALREYKPLKITVVFGCGGERDRKRRFDMGRIAAEMSDLIVLTNDNPRKESPKGIFDDIIKGMGEDIPYIVLPDRSSAISYAVSHCKPGEMVVVAGKGHEDYQITENGIFHLDDREEVMKAIEKVKNERIYI